VRIAESQIVGTLLAQLQRSRERTFVAQQQIASGKRVVHPADDPTAYGQIVVDEAQLAATDQWIRNIQFGSARITAADGVLDQVTTVLSRIKELAVGARSGTRTAADRATIAQEVRQLHRHLLQLANSEFGGQRLFAGTKTNQAPFVLGAGDTVLYQGNSETQSIEVGPNQTIPVTLPGNQVFAGPTTNVFERVAALIASLESNNESGIEQGIGDLDKALEQVTNARGQLGALGNRLEGAKGGLEQLKEIVTAVLSRNRDADLAQAASDLALHELALQAAAQIARRIFDSSLLRFLG
jgi:flagellar hook-associated protein 3 FlgL